MNSGVNSVNGKIVCAECGQTVGKVNEELLMNYCPKCGNPLNIDSAVALDNKISKEKIVTLYEAIDEIDEGKDAKQVLKDFIKELADNK
jgi:predicted amidophosphoribosyltransferase